MGSYNDNRIRYNLLPNGIEVQIKAPRNFGVLLFMIFWLVLWTGGGIMVLGSVAGSNATPQKLFGAVWLVVWVLAEIFVLFQVLWQLVGKEIVTIRAGSMYLQKSILRVFTEQVIDVNRVENLRAAGLFLVPFSAQASFAHWGFIGGSITFEAQGRNYKFGIGIQEEPAKALVDKLLEYLPRQRKQK